MGFRLGLGRQRSDADTAEEQLGAAFGLGVLSLVALHVLAAGLDMVLPSAGPRGAQATTSATAAALLAVVAVRHRVRPLAPALIPHAAGAVVLVAGLSAAVHLVLTGDPAQAMYLMLILVAAGAVLPVRGWIIALDTVSLVALVAAGLPRRNEPEWQHVAVVLLFAVAVAHLLQAMRGRAQRRLDELTAELAARATHDELTGLLNRRGLQEAARLVGGRPAAAPQDRDGAAGTGLLYLDIDGFKAVNDELGHAAGDAVLAEVADRLARLVGDSDLVARVGGDEFTVLLPTVDPVRLDRLGHQVRIRLTGTAGVLQLPWSVSVGSAWEPSRGAPVDRLARLLRAADLAMYRDKQTRRENATQPMATT